MRNAFIRGDLRHLLGVSFVPSPWGALAVPVPPVRSRLAPRLLSSLYGPPPRAEMGGPAGCRAASNTPLFQRGKAPGTSVRTEKPNLTQHTELKLKPPRFCLKSCVPCAPVTRNDKVIANISQASQRSQSNKEHEKQLCKQSLAPGSAAQARLCPSAPGSAGKTPPARPGCLHQHPQHVLPDCHRERFQKEIRKSTSIGFSADSSLAPGVLNGLPLTVPIHLSSAGDPRSKGR